MRCSLMLAAGVLAACSAKADDLPLVLTQVSTRLVPEFRATDLTLIDGWSLIVWSTADAKFALIEGEGVVRSWQLPGTPGPPLAMGWDAPTSAIQLVDSSSIITLDGEGNVRLRRPIELAAVAAADAGDAWYVVVREGTGGYSLRMVDSLGSLGVPVWTRRAGNRESGQREVLFLGTCGGRVLLTGARSPLWNAAVDLKSGSSQYFDPPSRVLGTDKRRPVDLTAGRMLCLTEGYLQSWVDRIEGSHWVVRYDSKGRIVSELRLTVPIVFVGAELEKRAVVGIMSLDTTRILTYRY